MARMLLVGGAGFIGRRAARMLAAGGVAARILDQPQALARLDARPGVEPVPGDATSPEVVAAAADGCDGVIHLAGIMTLDAAADPARAVRINVAASLNVLQAAAARGLPVAYLSSAGVFGPGDATHPRPMTIYGVTKLAVEGLARVFAADHGVPSLGLRPYIVYGPGVSSGVAAGPSIAIAAALRREPATIRFSGRVGFVHVDDVARLLVAGVTRPRPGAHVLTMAGDTREMTDFVAALRARTGWDGIGIDGPPLRIPTDLASDPTPAWLGDHPITGIEAGIDASLAELRGDLR